MRVTSLMQRADEEELYDWVKTFVFGQRRFYRIGVRGNVFSWRAEQLEHALPEESPGTVDNIRRNTANKAVVYVCFELFFLQLWPICMVRDPRRTHPGGGLDGGRGLRGLLAG